MLDLSPVEAFYGNGTLVLVLRNQEKLLKANPDIPYLKESKTYLSLTAPADEGEPYDFVSRFFAPAVVSTKTQ